MRAIVNRESLFRALSTVARTVDRASTFPILANVCLRVIGAKLQLVTTDLNRSSISTVDATDCVEGDLTLPAHFLVEIIKALPEGCNVSLAQTENQYCDLRATWRDPDGCGHRWEAKIVGMAARDFPKVPDPRELVFAPIAASTLRELLEEVIPSISTDETRYHLNGACLESAAGTLRARSTDGHRASCAARPVAGLPSFAPIIVPRLGCKSLVALLKDMGDRSVGLAINKGHLFIACEDETVSIKLIEAEFPPIEQTIRASSPTTAIVDRAKLYAEARTLATFARRAGGKWKVSLVVGVGPHGIRLRVAHEHAGETFRDLPATVTGDARVLAIEPSYLVDALAKLPCERVTLGLAGLLEALIVTGEGCEPGAIMPRREFDEDTMAEIPDHLLPAPHVYTLPEARIKPRVNTRRVGRPVAPPPTERTVALAMVHVPRAIVRVAPTIPEVEATIIDEGDEGPTVCDWAPPPEHVRLERAPDKARPQGHPFTEGDATVTYYSDRIREYLRIERAGRVEWYEERV